MNKALLDTDILADIGKAKDATVAANAKTHRRSFGHYTFSTVSVMEVVNGFQRTQATARLNAFLATFPHMEILPFDELAAELAGRIAGELARLGRPIGVADIMTPLRQRMIEDMNLRNLRPGLFRFTSSVSPSLRNTSASHPTTWTPLMSERLRSISFTSGASPGATISRPSALCGSSTTSPSARTGASKALSARSRKRSCRSR